MATSENDPEQQQEGFKEYTLYEDENGEQFVLLPEDENAPNGGNHTNGAEQYGNEQNGDFQNGGEQNGDAQNGDYGNDERNADFDNRQPGSQNGGDDLRHDENGYEQGANHFDENQVGGFNPSDRDQYGEQGYSPEQASTHYNDQYSERDEYGPSAHDRHSEDANLAPIAEDQPTQAPQKASFSKSPSQPQQRAPYRHKPRQEGKNRAAPAPKQEAQNRNTNKQNTSPSQDNQKPARGYIKGGMLIVDGGYWEPRAKVDHVNRDYHKSGGDVHIFHDKQKWEAGPRVDAVNRDYKPSGGQNKIFHEKPQWHAQPRIDTDNRGHVPGGGDVMIVHEKLRWARQPQVDARNPDYVPARGQAQIFDEKLGWVADAKVDNLNRGYKRGGGNVSIIDEKPQWQKTAKLDHQRPFYKPGGGQVKIVNRPIEWKASPKVDSDNRAYQPEGGNIRIMHEPQQWSAPPKVDARNMMYQKPESKVKITDVKMDWRNNTAAKVESLEKYYDYAPSADNVEYDPKSKRWVARGRDMRRPTTGQSLDSKLGVGSMPKQSPRRGDFDTRSSEGDAVSINRAPPGTTYTEYAQQRKYQEGYGNRFKDKKVTGVPLNLPPIDKNARGLVGPNGDGNNGAKVLFKSKDILPAKQDDGKQQGTTYGHGQSQPKNPMLVSKPGRKAGKENNPKQHTPRAAPDTPENMYRKGKAKPAVTEPITSDDDKSSPRRKGGPPPVNTHIRVVPQPKVERVSMKALEQIGKTSERSYGYNDYAYLPPSSDEVSLLTRTPSTSYNRDYDEHVQRFRKGYNAHRRDREVLKQNNKYTATEGLYHVPHRKRAEKVYS